MSITIRDMTSGDYDEVHALWKACPGVGLSESDSKEGVTRFLEHNRGLSFVALDADRLVGAVLCGSDGRRGYITHLAVDSENRREGVARSLVEHCLAALRRDRIDKCHIFVFHDNEGALGFWRRIGWIDRPELVVLSRFVR